MSPAGKRGVVIVAVAVVAAIVVFAVVTLSGGGRSPSPAAESQPATPTVTAPDPTTAAQQYLLAFSSRDAGAAGKLTDAPNAANAELSDAFTQLRPSAIEATSTAVSAAQGSAATADYTVSWTIGAGHVWTYQGTFGLVKNGTNWQVHWTPAVLFPHLAAGQRLALVTSAPNQNAVVDRDGKPLVVIGSGGTKLTDPDFASVKTALTSQIPTAATNVFAVERVDANGDDLETLFGSTGPQIATLTSTLSIADQNAAQAAVNSYTNGPAVILAIEPSTGGLLAVAQNSQSDTSPFSGLYPPGSTFKIVTATAALEAGLATQDTELKCPGTALVGQRTINNEGFDLGTVPMHTAFAKSCNTTFAQLAFELPPNGLSDTANQFGLNADFDIPSLNTQTGKVDPAAGPDEQVEDGIGQGTVLVSPFGEALMAATVDEGHAVVPQLWQNANTDTVTGYAAPPDSVLISLRTMMREVVTGGTATGLAESGNVFGKTGTAQFGNDPQQDAHGWFVGYRNDLAFVVFLQGAGDSRPAVTLGAKFLAGVH